MGRNEPHRVSTDSVEPHYPAPYDPLLDGGRSTGCLSLPQPSSFTRPQNRPQSAAYKAKNASQTTAFAATMLDKYRYRNIPGYTGYMPGSKFVAMSRTPFTTQALAHRNVYNDIVDRNGRKSPVFGHNAYTRPLPEPKTRFQLPNLHPDDHDHATCLPPKITGNPSNKHSFVLGDNRIPGTYSNRTANRERFRGPRPGRLLQEHSMAELFNTPSQRKHAYERAMRRVGKLKITNLMQAISDRIMSKLGNHGSAAFKLRSQLQFFAGEDCLISIDEFRTMFMSVCGISLDQEELLAVYGVYDADGSGYCDMTEMMQGLLDRDYFSCFLGKNQKLGRELTQITEGDKRSMQALLERATSLGSMVKVFRTFDANYSGRVSRSEFALGCEKLNCPLTSAGLEVFWSKCEQDGNNFVEYDEFCKMFAADYTDYLGGGQGKYTRTSGMVYGLASHQGAASGQASEGLLYKEERW